MTGYYVVSSVEQKKKIFNQPENHRNDHLIIVWHETDWSNVKSQNVWEITESVPGFVFLKASYLLSGLWRAVKWKRCVFFREMSWGRGGVHTVPLTPIPCVFRSSAMKPPSPSTAAWRTSGSPTGSSSPSSPWWSASSSTHSQVASATCIIFRSRSHHVEILFLRSGVTACCSLFIWCAF